MLLQGGRISSAVCRAWSRTAPQLHLFLAWSHTLPALVVTLTILTLPHEAARASLWCAMGAATDQQLWRAPCWCWAMDSLWKRRFLGSYAVALFGLFWIDLAVAIFHLGWFIEKGPYKSQEYTVFPTLFPSFHDLWGPFLGGQPKTKISILQCPSLRKSTSFSAAPGQSHGRQDGSSP